MKRKYSTTEVKACIQRMQTMKQAERSNEVQVFTDCLMRACVAVRVGADWFIVPRSRNGWSRRQRLTLTPLAELERLRPAAIDPAWLGIPIGEKK